MTEFQLKLNFFTFPFEIVKDNEILTNKISNWSNIISGNRVVIIIFTGHGSTIKNIPGQKIGYI